MSEIEEKPVQIINYIYSEDAIKTENLPAEASSNSWYSKYRKIFSNDRFFWILINLLLLAIVFPSIDKNTAGDDLLALFYALFLFTVPYELRNDDEAANFIYFFSLPGCLLGCALLVLPDNLPDSINPKLIILSRMIVHFLFYLSLAGYLLRELWLDKAVGFAKIMGACSLYLLVGMIWAYFYGIIEEFNPNSFAVSNSLFLDDDNGSNHHIRCSVLLYFSFITLTTVGFGDVSPIAPIARTVVWLEAVFGQFLVTILLARMVSLYLDYSKDQKSNAIKQLEEKVDGIPVPSEKYHPKHKHFQTADEVLEFNRDVA